MTCCLPPLCFYIFPLLLSLGGFYIFNFKLVLLPDSVLHSWRIFFLLFYPSWTNGPCCLPQDLTVTATAPHDLPFVKIGARAHIGPLCTCTLITHCQVSFGDKEQESVHGKADTTIALQIRFIRGVAKKETPRNPCPAAGIHSSVFNQVWKGAVGKRWSRPATHSYASALCFSSARPEGDMGTTQGRAMRAQSSPSYLRSLPFL